MSSDLEFYLYPFLEKQTANICVSPTTKVPPFGFGFDLKTDELYKRHFLVMLRRNLVPLSFKNPKMASKIILMVRSSFISMMILSFQSLMLLNSSSY